MVPAAARALGMIPSYDRLRRRGRRTDLGLKCAQLIVEVSCPHRSLAVRKVHDAVAVQRGTDSYVEEEGPTAILDHYVCVLFSKFLDVVAYPV